MILPGTSYILGYGPHSSSDGGFFHDFSRTFYCSRWLFFKDQVQKSYDLIKLCILQTREDVNEGYKIITWFQIVMQLIFMTFHDILPETEIVKDFYVLHLKDDNFKF